MTNGLTRRRFALGALSMVGAPALAMDVENYQRLGLDRYFMDGGLDAEVNGRSNMELAEALAVPEDAQYNPCAEAYPGPDVPRGTVRAFAAWDGTATFPGTVRDVWVYTPSQLPITPSSALSRRRSWPARSVSAAANRRGRSAPPFAATRFISHGTKSA